MKLTFIDIDTIRNAKDEVDNRIWMLLLPYCAVLTMFCFCIANRSSSCGVLMLLVVFVVTYSGVLVSWSHLSQLILLCFSLKKRVCVDDARKSSKSFCIQQVAIKGNINLR